MRIVSKVFYKEFYKRYKYKTTRAYQVKIPWLVNVRPNKKDAKRIRIFGGWAVVEDDILTIAEGYAWDGASGPAIDTNSFMRGSLVHDALYQMMREGLIPQYHRKDADQTMKKICIEDGMWKFRAWYTYLAVRIFAGPFAKKQNTQKPHLSAP